MILTENILKELVFDLNARLVNFASRYVGSQGGAADIVQECYVSLWSQYSGKVVVRPEALLYTMVRNRCIDSLRSMYLLHNESLENLFANPSCEKLYNLDFAVMHKDGESSMIYKDLDKSVNEAISSLPDRCREVFRMSRVGKMKNREIASALGISEKAVEKHITKAIKILTNRIRLSGFDINYSVLLMILLRI